MKTYIQPALRMERIEAQSDMLSLSLQKDANGQYKAADNSECYTEEEKTTSPSVWGEEW